MASDHAATNYGAKPPREMRTVRREGDVLTEDIERMNPDGTVTKTITVVDEKTGQKQVSAYKMDKSGIVRKLDEVEQKKEDLLQQLRNQLADTREKVQALREHQERENTKSVVYENVIPNNKNGVAYSRRVEEEIPDQYEIAHDMRNVNRPIELTPKQQAMIQEHKQNILNYGAQKLIKQLNKKLNEDKFNEYYHMSDDQKEKVIEYGIRKLHRLLEKNLDEEKLIYDVMSFNPDFGKVDLSGRGAKQLPGNQSVSFKLNPYKDIAPEEIAKPVSFSMRPEKPSKSSPDPETYGDQKVIHNGYKAIWDRLMKPESIMESVKGIGNGNENPKDEKYESASEKDESDWQQTGDEDQSERNDFQKMKDTVKKLMSDTSLYKKSRLTPEQKEGILNYALKQVRSVLKDNSDSDDSKKSSRKKKINLFDYFDEDEIFDYGKRALKKLVRRSLRGFDLDQDILRQDKIEDPDLAERRDAFYQYLGDIVEGRIKETDPLPLPEKNKYPEEEEEPEEKTKWDYNSLLSNIFGQKEKAQTKKSEENPNKEKSKFSGLPDFDKLFSWLQSDKEEKADAEKVTAQPSENVPKVKPRFYQLEPQADATNEQDQPENDYTRFDLKSLLKKIQEAAVKKFSEPKPDENIENNKELYQEQSQASINSDGNTQERNLKASDVDAALSRIRQNNNEVSNSRSAANKPPYLKERISGLNSIPIPKITTASPSDRKANFSDQISFQLKPHSYTDTDKLDDSGPNDPNEQRAETGKPCSHEQDFQPWWFESPESFVKKTLAEKPTIKGGYMGAPMINSKFSTGGNGFSANGSFSSRNALE